MRHLIKVTINQNPSEWRRTSGVISEAVSFLTSKYTKQFRRRTVVDIKTHPVQAAQVLDFMLVCVRLVVDDSVLFVHTAGLNHTKSSQSL